jgi:hypothetical protein
MVSVDAILETLTSLSLNEFVDPVAELFMDLDEVPSTDLQRKLCEAGMPAGRARAVKTVLTSRVAAPPAVTVSVCVRIPA